MATLVVALVLLGQHAPSSLAQNAAYRFSVNNASPQALVNHELHAQGAARHRQTVDAEVTEYVANAKAAQLTQYLNAVAAAQAAQKAQQQAYAVVQASNQVTASGADSGGWAAVAMCEEGGNNDPNYGYYGIKEWNGYDGYPTAGSAPQSVQLQWEEQNVGSPPNESGGCHSY
jgi:hypothetical protein